MSTARGILNYLDKVDAAEAVEQEKQNTREALAFELQMKYGDNFLTSSGKNKEGSITTSTATAALMKEYNLNEETLAPILATGDKTAAPKLLSILEDQKQKYGADGFDLPEDVISGIVESAVMTQSTSRDIDFTEIEKFIGREMDSLYKDMLKSQSKDPGSVFFPEPVFTRTPGLEDITRFEKKAIGVNLTRAQSELDMVKSKIAEFVSLSENGNLTPDQTAENGWLTNRKVEIESSIDSYNNKDNLVPLAGLYGTAYTRTLQQVFPIYKDEFINEALLDASRQEITVPNRAVAESLYDAGILREGDIVTNGQTGKKIRIGG